MNRKSLRRMLLLWTLAACAAAGQSAAAASEPSTVVGPRLDQSLTLDLTQVPLSDLCWVMAQRTGIAHRAADAATGDLLVDAVGTLTVAQLHQALAVVLGVGWKWSAKGSAPGYVVERLPEKRMEEAREQTETDRALGESLRRLLAAANLPEGAEDVPADLRPWLENPGRREAVRMLGELTPEEQAQVLAGGGVDRALASLSPAGQARVKRMMEELRRAANQRADESLAEPGGPRLRHWEPLDLGNGEAWRIRIAPTLGWGPTGEALYSVHVYSPKEFGFGEGWGLFGPPGRPDPSRYHLTVTGAGRPVPGDQSSPGPDHPALNADRPPLPDHLISSGRSWDEIARNVARTLGCPVVSGAYRSIEFVLAPIDPVVKEDSLESYLDRACRFALNRRWGRAGPVLLFQRCDWATRRRAQIPEAQARRWRQQIIDTGRVSLDHMVEMAALTPCQLPNLADVLGPPADGVWAHGELLRFWKALPASSRTALQGQGLAIRDLPLAVQPRARALVSGMMGSSAPLLLSNATLKVEQTDDAFTFSVILPGRPAVQRRIDLTCPPRWPAILRKEAETRAAALRAAAGSSLPPADGTSARADGVGGEM